MFLFLLKDLNWDRLWEIQRGNVLPCCGYRAGGMAVLCSLPAPGAAGRCPVRLAGLPLRHLAQALSCLRCGLTVVPWPAALVGSVSTCSCIPSPSVTRPTDPGPQRWRNTSSPSSQSVWDQVCGGIPKFTDQNRFIWAEKTLSCCGVRAGEAERTPGWRWALALPEAESQVHTHAAGWVRAVAAGQPCD